jgi:hypothetical protein
MSPQSSDGTSAEGRALQLEGRLDYNFRQCRKCVFFYILMSFSKSKQGGLHEIIKNLTILQGKCRICTLKERINSQKTATHAEHN